MFDCPWILISGSDHHLVDERVSREIRNEKAGKRRIPKNDRRFLPQGEALLAGARGEIAASRYFYLEWSSNLPNPDHMNGDLELGIEVKATDWPDGNLHVSQKTLNDYLVRSRHVPIVLARTGMWPYVEFPGWIFAGEVSKFPFKKTNHFQNDAFQVPVSELRPIYELEALISSWKLADSVEENS